MKKQYKYNKQTAIEAMTHDYNEACEKYPTLRNDVTLERYIKVNLPYKLKVTVKPYE